MENTPIEWCDSSVNPVMGCDGCELWNKTTAACYAGQLVGRNLNLRAGKVKAATLRGEVYDGSGGKDGFPDDFGQPMTFAGRMRKAALLKPLAGTEREDKPWLANCPRLIFVSDMGDALSANISFNYLEAEIIQSVISKAGKEHIWLWLTKRPARMAEFSAWLLTKGIPWPTNLWAFTSVTNQATANSRIPDLLKVGNEGTIRCISAEPLWGPVNLSPWLTQLDWVIVGGESGVNRRPTDLAWPRALRDQCTQAGVSFFFKQVGGPSNKKGSHFYDIPADLRIRQTPKEAKSTCVAWGTEVLF